jgi:hypothetical protein
VRLVRKVIVSATLLTTAVVGLSSTSAYAQRQLPAAGSADSGRSAADQAVAPAATCTQQSFLEGDHYSAVQVAQLARQAGFSGNDWVISVAVAEAESAGWTHARLINTDCSVDRGLWQINSYWHGEVSDSCAFDPTCNAQATHTIWANGGWTQWTTYNNGAYQAHMAEAQAAVAQVGGGGSGGGTSRIIGYTGKCVDVPAGNGVDGQYLIIWDCNGGNNQNWTFPGDGTIRDYGLCMDVAWGSTADGAVVQLANCSGNPAQQWVLTAAGDLVNPQANKCLDVKDWNSANGARLQTWTCTGGSNQKWYRG